MKRAVVAGAGAAAGLTPRRVRGDKGAFNRVYYRQLGSTGFKVSELGFGCMNTRDSALVHAAIDAGVNYFDTAHYYMNGVNEEMLGEVMKSRRNEVFLATKTGLGKDIKAIPGEIETSLKRLKTDHVDLLLFHKLDSRDLTLNEDYMKVFDEVRRKGQARFIGITTHSNQAEVLNAAVESDFWEAVLTGYNYYSPKEVTDAIRRAREAGLAIIAMKSLITTERPRKPFPDIRGENKSVTNQQALLKWVLDNEYIDTIIPGITAFEQLEDDVAIMGLELSYDDRRTIRRYSEAVRDRYCCGVSGCTGCRDRCPNGVAVHEINRCLNYAEGYGDKELARANFNAIAGHGALAACEDCDECTVQCVNGLDIPSRLERARFMFS